MLVLHFIDHQKMRHLTLWILLLLALAVGSLSDPPPVIPGVPGPERDALIALFDECCLPVHSFLSRASFIMKI